MSSVIRWIAAAFLVRDEMRRRMDVRYETATIRWPTSWYYRRGFQMKRTITALISFTMLCYVSMNYGQAEENLKPDVFTVVEAGGNVFQKGTVKDTLVRLTVGETLNQDAFISIVKDGTLKLKRASGEEIVLKGPSQGKLQDLLTKKPVPGDFVRKTLSKIPAAKGDEKKVDMSTQSAGLTRGAKSPRKSMPYIWKVKKKAQQSDNESK